MTKYEVEVRGKTAVMHVGGRLTFAEASGFKCAAEELAEMDKAENIVDLSDLERIDSFGLGLLVLLYDLLQARRGTLVLRGARREVKELLDLTRFQTIVDILD